MAGAQDYVAVSFTGDSRDAVSAAQQLRRALKEVEAGAVSSSNTLAAAANRTVAEQAKQVRGSRELLEAYRQQAKIAEQGSAEQVAATRLAEREARKLGETVRVSSAQATRGFDESHGSLQRLVRGGIAGSGVFSSLGRQIAFASGSFLGGAGLVGAIASTVRVAADFQRSLNVMGAVSHATAQQMREVSAEAKRLGNDARLPATSARDAAVAMTELAKAGVSVDETLHAARGTLQLAAAAQIEERDAAQITARALNAFALSGTQATRVADVLASVANAASGEMGDFAIALQQSSSVAHQVGLTLEDTVAALGRLAQAGLTGSDAGTSLRVMLQRLIPQTSKAAEEMAHLGITWKDAHGNILPLRDMISQYQTALERLTPAQRQHALQVIFGTDAQRAANILLLGGVDAFDRMRHAVTEHGAAARLAAAQNKGFTGALDALGSAVQTLQIGLGTLLLPTLTRYLRKASNWLSDTENQATVQRDFKSALDTVGQALQDVAGAIKKADQFTGGFKHTLELLIGLALVSKLSKFAEAFGVLAGTEAATGAAGGIMGAAGAAKLLRVRLLALARLGPIVIPVIIAYSFRKQIKQALFDDVANAPGLPHWDSRQNKWVDDNGHPVADQAYWNRNAGMFGRAKSSTGGVGTAAAESPRRQQAAQTPRGGGVQSRIVSTAKTALGVPYQYGGAPSLSRPTDCSGLMVAVFAKNGISLPRTSQEQYAQAPIKDARPLLPGDLVFSEGIHPGHVGLYIGNGQVLEDPHTGDHVKIIALNSFGWNGESARWWGGTQKAAGRGGGASPGLAPGAGKGKKAKKASAPDLVPDTLELPLAKAQAQGSKAGEIAALRAIEKYLLDEIARTKNVKKLTALYNELDQVRGQIATLTKKPKPTATDLIPPSLQRREALAETTKGTADDLRALEAIEAYLVKRYKHEKNINKQIEILHELASVRSQIEGIRKKDPKAKAKAEDIVPPVLEEARERAKLTKGMDDDLRILNEINEYLTKRLSLEKDRAKRIAIIRELQGVRGEIADIRGQKGEAGVPTKQALLGSLLGILTEAQRLPEQVRQDVEKKVKEIGDLWPKIADPNVRKQVRDQIKQLRKDVVDELTQFRDDAIGRVQDIITTAMDARYVGAPAAKRARASGAVARATNVVHAQQTAGRIQSLEAAGMTAAMQQIHDLGQAVVDGLAAVRQAIMGGSEDAVIEAASQLANARSSFDAISGELTDSEQQYLTAWQGYIEAVTAEGEDLLDDWQQKEESSRKVKVASKQKALAQIFAAVRAGKVTWEQAQRDINEILAPLGLSLADLGDVMDTTELQTALSDLQKAIEALTDFLKTPAGGGGGGGGVSPTPDPSGTVGAGIGKVKPPIMPEGYDAMVSSNELVTADAGTTATSGTQTLVVTYSPTIQLPSGLMFGSPEDVVSALREPLRNDLIRLGKQLGGADRLWQ